MRALKLEAVKHALNAFSPVLLKMVPGTGSAKPVCVLTRRLFALLRKALRLHPEAFFKDQNFPLLLQALERTLIFIGEEDSHYAGWEAMTMLLIHDLVAETRPQFGPGPAGDALWIQWAASQRVAKIVPQK